MQLDHIVDSTNLASYSTKPQIVSISDKMIPIENDEERVAEVVVVVVVVLKG
jgi:hypothetical protein